MDISRWLEQNVGARLLMLHDKVYIASDGRIGHTIPGGPSNLILHTVGAKTGQKRDNTLSYARDGDDYLVVASKGGAPTHPAWYLNLSANPDVEIQVEADRMTARAHTATPEERAELWPIMTKQWPAYDDYQSKTDREIPVVVLEVTPGQT